MTCSACGGPGFLLGVLGRLRWFRCRNCGIDFNRKIKKAKKNQERKVTG